MAVRVTLPIEATARPRVERKRSVAFRFAKVSQQDAFAERKAAIQDCSILANTMITTGLHRRSLPNDPKETACRRNNLIEKPCP